VINSGVADLVRRFDESVARIAATAFGYARQTGVLKGGG
jgi:hypothetical protein